MQFNLKTAVILSGLLISTARLSAQETDFTLLVKMTKPAAGHKVFLYYKNDEAGNAVDSAIYSDGQFELKGKTLHPQRAFICLAPSNKGLSVYSVVYQRIPVYLEAGNIVIKGTNSLKEAKIGGTPLNEVFQGYSEVTNSFTPALDVLREKYGRANQKRDTAALLELAPSFAAIDKEKKMAEERYFFKHLNSPVSLDWLKSNFVVAKSKSKTVMLFRKMGDSVKKSASGQAYSKVLDQTQSVEIGSTAPNFTAKNVEDVAVSLNSFRGKYVLLDFWASWCVPCRQENPNVLKVYNAYKSKNFTVLGFSMDSSKSSWINAVAKDALPWTQVSSMDHTGELAGVLYGITAIPSNFLIDPKGKIIAMDLRGEELEKALAKFIKG